MKVILGKVVMDEQNFFSVRGQKMHSKDRVELERNSNDIFQKLQAM